ncbi:Uncharacterised protein [uncultured archaeon]|nr:Uncharacterised protein [uncultured archaeon]
MDSVYEGRRPKQREEPPGDEVTRVSPVTVTGERQPRTIFDVQPMGVGEVLDERLLRYGDTMSTEERKRGIKVMRETARKTQGKTAEELKAEAKMLAWNMLTPETQQALTKLATQDTAQYPTAAKTEDVEALAKASTLEYLEKASGVDFDMQEQAAQRARAV